MGDVLGDDADTQEITQCKYRHAGLFREAGGWNS